MATEETKPAQELTFNAGPMSLLTKTVKSNA